MSNQATNQNTDMDQAVSQGTNIEVRPITQENTKEKYIERVIQNVVEDIHAWLEAKDLITVKKYISYDPLDLFLEYINDYSNALYRRIRRITEVSNKLSRFASTGTGTIRSPRDIEQLIYQKLASGLAESLGATVEETRRKRAVEEIIRELKSEQSESENTGGDSAK